MGKLVHVCECVRVTGVNLKVGEQESRRIFAPRDAFFFLNIFGLVVSKSRPPHEFNFRDISA